MIQLLTARAAMWTSVVSFLASVAIAGGVDGQGVSTTARPEPLELGVEAPKLQAHEWLRGTPVTDYEQGEAYVLDFWATWCAPCIASMPHLSKVQKEYEDDGLTVVAVNIDSVGNTGRITPAIEEKVKTFVANNESKMGFSVMMDDFGKTDTAIRQAAGVQSIPSSVIIDRQGRVAWIGHPMRPDFDEVVRGVLDGSYDVAKVAEASKLAREAVASFRAGDRAVAFEKIDRVLELHPSAHARLILDKLQLMSMDADKGAAVAYGEVLAIGPFAEDSRSLARIANVLNQIDSDDARGVAMLAGAKAVELTKGENAGYLAVHAETYAKGGDFDEAVKILERASALVGGESNLGKQIQDRLESYKAGSVG